MGRRNSGGAGQVALVGVLAALSLVLLLLASVSPSGRMGIVAVAGLVNAAAVISGGLHAGFLCWAVAGILGLILSPDKGNVLLYLVFFGLYPMVKSLIEQLRKAPLEWLCKLAFFNVVLTFCWLVLRDVLLAGLPAVFEQLWVLYVGGNVVFLIYDYGFSKLVMFYAARIDKAIRRR